MASIGNKSPDLIIAILYSDDAWLEADYTVAADLVGTFVWWRLAAVSRSI